MVSLQTVRKIWAKRRANKGFIYGIDENSYESKKEM